MKGALLSKCQALVVLLLMPTLMLAQGDVVDVDSIGKDSLMVTQYDFDEFDRVDFCHTPQYVIVTKNGKVVARLIPEESHAVFLTDALTGVIKGDYDLDQIKEEYVKEKYETADR